MRTPSWQSWPLLAIGLCSPLVCAAATAQQRFSSGFGSLSSNTICQNCVTEALFSHTGVGHFSEWSALAKAQFLRDAKSGKASNWTLVMGNEGGDLDSMASALTWAYHLGHVDPSRPAIGLLQTPEDALDLRPENKLALENARMSSGHSDLLTIDELPIPADQLASQLRGIVLVDHPEPLAVWRNATVLSVFDHHTDRGSCPDAEPRIFVNTASCSTLVGKQMLDEIEKRKEYEYHLPHELLEMLLSAIAIDSKGLQSRIATPTDKFVASRLWKRSNWSAVNMYKKMEDIADVLKAAKKNLGHLNVRDLLRRDWKGSIVETPASRPDINLGFASIPYSLTYQMSITPGKTAKSWFAIERNWTSEIRADATIALNSYKTQRASDGSVFQEEGWMPWSDDDDDDDEDDENEQYDDQDEQNAAFAFPAAQLMRRRQSLKERQIVLVVRHDHRLNETLADELFRIISDSIETSDVLGVQPWRGPGWEELGPRQMVWTHTVVNGGRKLIRPIVEDAVSRWNS